MAIQIKAFVEAKQAENAQTTQYTAVNVKATIDAFTATNTTSSTATISVNILPSGASASVANLLVDEKAILPGESYSFPELIGHVLESGDAISTLAGTASAITIRISGREVTS